ncbi:YceI family protein [Alphaproteobacteria bacterium]|nr:YceI family protein [Alphaproteobacteria bacterium]
MKFDITTGVFIFLYCIFSNSTFAKEAWVLDKELSTINFEIPVFLAKNVRGQFSKIEGLVELDLNVKENNKAIFSIDISSVEINYKKYRNLLLSNIFFDVKQFPIALVDTKKFSYEDESELEILIDLYIKGITETVPLKLEVRRLAEELVQIKGKLEFSRTAFKIGTGKWSSTVILKDNASIETDLFLFRE